MPVVNVGPVDVGVFDRLMDVEMVVLFRLLRLVVFVEMVLVVGMGVGMGESLMSVEVPMGFPIEEKHPQKHDGCGGPELCGGSFPENNDGEDGANERP